MKLAASHIGWQPEDEPRALALLRQYGFAGLEIAPGRALGPNPYDKPAEAAVYTAGVLGQYGLRVCSMQSIWFGLAGSMFGAERDFLLGYTKQAIAFAGAAGIGNLVFGCPKNRVLPEGKTAEDAVSFFRPLAKEAEKHGACLALEANPPIYGTNFMNTTPDALDVARRVASPGCKVNLDFGTLIENGEDVETLRGALGQINHVHISEPYLAPVQPRAEHRRLAAILKEEGYAGYVSLEMKSQPLNVVEKTLAYLVEVFT